jgi:hypothetical protein
MLHNIRRLKTELLQGVESLVKERNLSYLDATLYFCEENEVDFEQAAKIIMNDKVLVAKIEIEAEDLNFLKKSARLPI